MYIGLDLHKEYSHVAVMTDDGDLTAEYRIDHEPGELETFAEEYAGSNVAMEATGSYRYVYEILDQSMEVTLVNPSQTRVFAEAKGKTDSIDAKMLAHLLRADLVAESYVPPEEIRQARDLVRARKSLVEERTAEKNRVRAVLSRTGHSYDGDLFGEDGRTFFEELELSTVDRGIIEAHMAAIDALNEQIRKLELTIQDVAEAGADTQRLMSIPGVSYFTGLLIKSEIGEIDRFPSADHLVSYAGLDPSVRQSGDKEIRGGITKQGSAPLRWALVQCANVAVRHDDYLGNFYTRLRDRKSHQVAIVATARKMLVSIFHMLDREEVYQPYQAA